MHRTIRRPGCLAIACVLLWACGAEQGSQSAANPDNASDAKLERFCDRPPRAVFASLKKHPASTDWFEVYEVAPATFAIYEPFQWQEVISYLIVGDQEAVLFDTGNGIADIRSVVHELTDRPTSVINSHSHLDHIGGNHQFERILSVATEFSIRQSAGAHNANLALEVSDDALCKPLPDGVTPDNHRTRPYIFTRKLTDGEMVDLGGRQLEIVRIPGHTDDSIALLEREPGYLWSGDSFYEGPIWLFLPHTDLDAYADSVQKLAELAPELTAVFPAHNTPRANPQLLIALRDNFARLMAGEVEGIAVSDDQVEYRFEGFSFLLRNEDR